ncbi:MAG: UDP binding domain-containing protein, partial [Alphaproteobacteria bacterium]
KDMALKIINTLSKRGCVKGKIVSILGITFKPETDDLREAPSLDIIPILQEEGIHIRAYDPMFHINSQKIKGFPIKNIEWGEGVYETLNGTDCAVILTEWNEFRALDTDRIKKLLKSSDKFLPLIIDLRNIYKQSEMTGIEYISIGRQSSYQKCVG